MFGCTRHLQMKHIVSPWGKRCVWLEEMSCLSGSHLCVVCHLQNLFVRLWFHLFFFYTRPTESVPSLWIRPGQFGSWLHFKLWSALHPPWLVKGWPWQTAALWGSLMKDMHKPCCLLTFISLLLLSTNTVMDSLRQTKLQPYSCNVLLKMMKQTKFGKKCKIIWFF